MKNEYDTLQDIFSNDSNFCKLKNTILEENNITLNVLGIDDNLIDLFIRIVANSINSSFIYSSKDDEFEYKIFDIKSTYSEVTKFLKESPFSFRKTINESFEYNICGENIDICIGNFIYRISFNGEIIEDITKRDFLTFKIIDFKDHLFIPLNDHTHISSLSNNRISLTKIIFSDFDNSKYENFKFDYNIFPKVNFNLFQKIIPKHINTIIINTKREIPEYLLRYKIIEIKDIDFPFGFISENGSFAVLTDKELYGEFNLNLYRPKHSKRIITDFFDGKINIGDYIVHINHGLGIFKGLILKDNKEYLAIEYKDHDMLYVPVEISERITKYIAEKNRPLKITKLGSREWGNILKKVNKDIENIAKEIILTHAKRSVITKPTFQRPILDIEREFNNNFEYIETKDQISAINDVLSDIYSTKVMDRVIVGDVGFGKTEVAIRAVFHEVFNNKQVVLLSPTSVLSEQHLKVFRKRFDYLPFRIEKFAGTISQLDRDNILKDLENGNIDILISTHKILYSNIQFKNLGLIIVDEEQRFGVKQKEKLKQIKEDIDFLSLSATPIPRTLYSSLSGIREISVIATPPQGRVKIETSVIGFDINKFIEIIHSEIKRGGGVYFIHNRISSLILIEQMLHEKDPKLKIEIAHSKKKDIHHTIKKFSLGKIDVLLSTSIVENGIDLPIANTIIINQAFNFGLSDLYQLRGRVGRSTNKAYCYLVVPKSILKRNKKVKDRINTILLNQSIGSGFHISLKDLEIRGAGNIVGVKQHGNISKIGVDLYSQLLDNAISKLNPQN